MTIFYSICREKRRRSRDHCAHTRIAKGSGMLARVEMPPSTGVPGRAGIMLQSPDER